MKKYDYEKRIYQAQGLKKTELDLRIIVLLELESEFEEDGESNLQLAANLILTKLRNTPNEDEQEMQIRSVQDESGMSEENI